jgi:t-SNARE complex subunit (syntaxin)
MTRDTNFDKDNKDVEKESDLRKFLKKRSFIYLMCAVAFVVIVVPDMIAPTDLEKSLVENLDTDEQNTAWNIGKYI